MALKRRPVVIRRLSLDLGLLVAGLCLVFFAIYSYRDAQLKTTIAENYVIRNADNALKEYQETFSAPIKSDLNRIREWGASGLLQVKDPFVLNKIFIPIVRENALVNQLDLSDSSGFRYSLLRQGSEWHTWIVRPDTLEGRTRRIISSDSAELLGDQTIEDPATLFGYRTLVGTSTPGHNRIKWSPLYVNADLGEEAIAASTSWRNGPLGTHVLTLEILLNNLFEKVETMSNEGPGVVFLLNGKGQVLSPTEMDPTDSTWRSVITSVKDLPEGPMKLALLGFAGQDDHSTVVENEFQNDLCWSSFRSVDPGESPMWLGFVVLESELLSLLRPDHIDLIYIGSAILLIALVFGWSIVRKYRHQLKDLPGKSLKPNSSTEEIRALIAKDESATLEFKSTMRKNLRSGKKDKAIEIAFLKNLVAFMNTDGGTLLMGINDDGGIVGLEEDEFANDDKCQLHFKNLFKQHIGMEFSKYVEFFLKEAEGKQIAVAVCQRSKAPVFLKHEGKEVFYIRNGPASEELPPSKVLSRMKGRR